ncbi:MAG: M16 family metallopeptidase, partial [Prevotella sp.]
GRAVDLLTDIVLHSVYPQHEIEKEVDVICDEIESYNDSPAELIYDDFENLLFAGHPLGHNILGTPDRLRTYSGDDIRAFARRHYRPENAVFFAYGDLDFRRLVAHLRKATADMPCAEPSAGSAPAAMPLPDYTPREVQKERGTHQSHVMIGCRAYGAHDERRMPLYLLNNILGGPGMNARLNLSLRERHGLVYTVESTMTSYSDTGIWSIYFGCDKHDTDKCRRLVRKELDRMMERRLSDTQLKTAKKQLKGQIAVACDNRESFALDFAKGYLHYGRKKDMERMFEDIDALTSDELQSVAQRLFAPENLTTLIFR